VSGGAGELAPERRDELVTLFWRLRVWDWGIESWRGGLPRVRSEAEGV
jgi:hypothetical protein